MDLADELEISRVAGAGNRPECSGSEASVRIVERRRIAYVESFRAELEIHSLGDAEGLPDHQIRILQPWAAHRIPRTAAKSKLRRHRESRGIEPLPGAAAVECIGITEAIGP